VNLSTRAKILLGIGLVVAGAVWLVLLDYGINAGRIHYGVHVRGVAVGGMTLEEARDALRARGKQLRKTPVELSAEGMECSFVPASLGWDPETKKTAQEARSVGFRGGLGNAFRERVTAWFGGVEVDWAGEPRASRVTPLVDDCEVQAEALQLELDRAKLMRLIPRAITTWPRRIFEIPVATAD